MSILLQTLPRPLEFRNLPTEWQVINDANLTLKADGLTDLFFAPDGTNRIDNAPAALFKTTDQNFSLRALVRVEFEATFDAGALQIRTPRDDWAKLCFEYSPFKERMIVSVVTRGTSDDCNSVVMEGNSVYLRIARLGGAFAFHYSTDGKFWNLVRHFALGAAEDLHLGFSAQSPRGEGCVAHFSEIEYRAQLITDIRSGE